MAPSGSNKRSCPSQPTPAPPSKRQQRAPATDDGDDGDDAARGHFHDSGFWRDAPVLTGSTKFAPLADCKNILVTGGAGFMFVFPLLCAIAAIIPLCSAWEPH